MDLDLDDLWDYDDPTGSEQRLREAAEATSGAERLVLLTQAARALGLQERYPDGHALLREVAAEAAPYPVVGARIELEQGRLHRSAGDPAAAGASFSLAEGLARTAGDDALVVDALHMQALEASSPADALEVTGRALEVARSSSAPAARQWEASLLNNLGCSQVDEGRLEEALATFEAALAVRRARGQHRETQIARWMVGWALRLLGRVEEALAVQRALRGELDAEGTEDPYVDEEIALLLASQSDKT